ncbi:MAG: CBS domain-containing protein [Gammaproteobacteria bacterium]|nr:CBS domain-containing protein [Gammaproteobacteria bacterium]MDH4256292.1 CBS domain-containing protein [Gammaproteobacteria bacterium]MDH5309363.1 CBS domain-containing protein [Gammaproteobacteria bacterium]
MIEIETIMSTDLVTVTPEDTVERARVLMHDRRIHHLPVVNGNDEIVGLVTLSNVLAATDSFLRDEGSRIHPDQIRIADIMVADVVTVDQHAGIRQAALFLEKHRIGCLPVVSDGKLTGIITDTDFVGVAINLLEQMEWSEPDEQDVQEIA